MAPSLAALDRTKCNTDLYFSTVREEDQGGLSVVCCLSPQNWWQRLVLTK